MALPLVLSLTDLLLALAAVVIGWGPFARPRQRPEAARVVAAAQRGALDLMGLAAPFGGVFLVVLVGGSASAQGPVRELVLASLAGAVGALGGAWLCGFQVAQAAARLSSSASPEAASIELGRLSTATLLLGSAVGSGLVSFAFAAFDEAPARAALMGATAAVGLLTILARPGVLSWTAATRSRRATDLHPGSLAEFAGATFAGSWLLHVTLFSISALGQVALFVLARGVDHGLGTFALLLPRVGLFALVCGGLGTRTSARDGAQAGWLRQLAIALVVLAFGAWALRGVLVGDAARSWAPGLVSYLCGVFGFAAWLLGTKTQREPTFAAPLALVPVLLLTLVVDPSELGGESALLLLTAGTGVALVPLAAAFRVGATVLSAATTCNLLAHGVTEPSPVDPSSRLAPSPGQQGMFLPWAVVVLLCAASVLRRADGGAHFDLLMAGLTALASAFLLQALSRRQDALGDEGRALLTELSEQRPQDGSVLLGEGLAVLQRVGGREQLTFALTLLLPPLVILLLSWTGSPRALELCTGALAGALLWAALADRSSQKTSSRAAASAFVWPLALYHLCWAALLST